MNILEDTDLNTKKSVSWKKEGKKEEKKCQKQMYKGTWVMQSVEHPTPGFGSGRDL